MIERSTLEAFLKAGISIIPLKKDKSPNIKSWQKYNKTLYKLGKSVKEFESVGMVMGDINGAETLDVDQKYDIPKKGEATLIERLEKKVELFAPGLWDKLTIATTVNGGYHLIYKVAKMGGSVKLAMRPATKEEAKKGTKQVVLLETRGQKSYIACKPAEGYEIKQGKLFGLKEITVEERDMLFACARMFDQVLPPVFMKDPNIEWNSEGLTPWEDYSDRGDWRGVLTKHGWTIVKEVGSKTFVKRPGATSPMSGNFDSKYNLLRVFSSSSVFDHNQSYNPFAIYSMLECGGDIKQAARELREAGYGRTPELKYKKKDEPVEFDNTNEFLSGEDSDSKLEAYATGKIKQGLTTGSAEFDKFYRFKPKSFDIIGGTAGLGKTTIALWLAALSNALHGWRWIIYSTENEVFELKMYILEFLYCENVQQISPEHRKLGIDYINKNFFFIESDDMLSHLDLFDMAEKIIEKHGKFNAMLIDPINSLKIDFTETDRKLNTHQYTVEMSTKMKHWAKKQDMSLYVGMHGNTESARRIHMSGDLKGNPAPLNAADLSDGVVWENKCDHMILIHRYKFVPELRTQTQFAVKKVKSTYSGGEVTPLDSPVIFQMGRGYNRNCFGFYDINKVNPLKDWFKTTILGEVKTKEELVANFESTRTQIQEETPEKLAEDNFARGTIFKKNIEDPPF